MKQEVSKNITINGSETSFTATDTNDFGQFVDSLIDDLSKSSQVITEIQIDGKVITEENEKTMRALPVESISKIEIFTSTPQDLAFESLGTLDQYLDRLMVSIDRASLHYKDKNLVAGDTYFLKTIDGLDLFIQTIGGVKMALKVGLNNKVALAEADMMSTLNEIVLAKKQNNYIYLAELLDKDLMQSMQEWKNDIIPFLKNWKMA